MYPIGGGSLRVRTIICRAASGMEPGFADPCTTVGGTDGKTGALYDQPSWNTTTRGRPLPLSGCPPAPGGCAGRLRPENNPLSYGTNLLGMRRMSLATSGRMMNLEGIMLFSTMSRSFVPLTDSLSSVPWGQTFALVKVRQLLQ